MNLKKQLVTWAQKYEVPDFIKTDPIQFPHRFNRKQDIEISALITAYLAFGHRPQIIKKVTELHHIMGKSPLQYIQRGDFSAFPAGNKKFYRFVSYDDMNYLLQTLHNYYTHYDDLETALNNCSCESPIEALQTLFGHIHYMPAIGSLSANKRMSMLLRWLVRDNSPVDLGIWQSMDKGNLLIPVDVHVHRMSIQLGVISRKSADMVMAVGIRDFFKEIFPGDPAKGDFSLFGYAVNNPFQSSFNTDGTIL